MFTDLFRKPEINATDVPCLFWKPAWQLWSESITRTVSNVPCVRKLFRDDSFSSRRTQTNPFARMTLKSEIKPRPSIEFTGSIIRGCNILYVSFQICGQKLQRLQATNCGWKICELEQRRKLSSKVLLGEGSLNKNTFLISSNFVMTVSMTDFESYVRYYQSEKQKPCQLSSSILISKYVPISKFSK